MVEVLSTLKYYKYIAWYLSISTSTMVTFKRYSSTQEHYSSTSTNVLGTMPDMHIPYNKWIIRLYGN